MPYPSILECAKHHRVHLVFQLFNRVGLRDLHAKDGLKLLASTIVHYHCYLALGDIAFVIPPYCHRYEDIIQVEGRGARTDEETNVL